MAVRDKSAAVGGFEAELGRDPIRGEKTTVDDSYLDGLSSKLESDPVVDLPPAAPQPVIRHTNGGIPPPPPPEALARPKAGHDSTIRPGPPSPPPSITAEDEVQELGSFDAQPIPSEATKIEEEEDDLAAIATKIFTEEPAGSSAAALDVVSGRDRGKSFPLTAEIVSVGRGIDNDVVLTDIAVSRKHLKIHRRDGYFELEELGSGNGTSRNGTRVRGRVVLLSGDRIELGNTTFSFAWDGAPPAGALEKTGALSTGAVQPAAMPKAVARSATEQMVRAVPVAKRAHPLQAGKLVVFGGSGLILFLLALVVIMRVLPPSDATDVQVPQGASVAELQSTGVAAYAARQWDTALVAFEQLAKLAPGDPSVREYISRSEQEKRAEQMLTQARSLAESSPREALMTLAAVPTGSVYQPAALGLRQDLSKRRVAEIVGQVEAGLLQPSPDTAHLLALIEEGLTLDSNHARLQERRAQIQAASSDAHTHEPAPAAADSLPQDPLRARGPRRPRNPRQPRDPRSHEEPRVAPATANARALALYRTSRFREAADAASAAADSASGRVADQARALARDIEQFATTWGAAQSQRGDPSGIRNLESALRLDRRISGGHFGSQIQPLLLEAHVQNATRAWQARRYPSACQSAQAALRIDGGNRAVSSLTRNCADKAREFYEQANAMRQSDPNRARELWRQVLQLVSRDNEYYQRAYEKLNNAAGAGSVDEDE